jgi:hypothetical protein
MHSFTRRARAGVLTAAIAATTTGAAPATAAERDDAAAAAVIARIGALAAIIAAERQPSYPSSAHVHGPIHPGPIHRPPGTWPRLPR